MVGQKIKKSPDKKETREIKNINQKFFFREIAFLASFEIAKNGIWSKKLFVKMIYLTSRVFLAWTFFNFPAHCD